MNLLALNSGSSSLKFGLYRVQPAQVALLHSGDQESTAGDTVDGIAAQLAQAGMPQPDAIGHRIVHGGPRLRQPCLIDDAILQQLQAASAFAPLHTPASLSVIRQARQRYPRLAQVACFDTGFHADMPDIASTLPVALELRAAGIRRYGFHGLSCESIVRQLGRDLPARLVIAHLGNGASITAVRDGQSIDTSMGLTPTGGIVMGTRSGDLDPGVLAYLMREKNYDATMIEDLVDHRCGLLGVSGIASDLRKLHQAAPSSASARLAIDLFCRSAAKQIAAMIAVLDGLDLVVFTGGIGEHDAEVRARICSDLSWIGVRLDTARNASKQNPVHDAQSRCAVQVMESQEDEQIARHAWTLLQAR